MAGRPDQAPRKKSVTFARVDRVLEQKREVHPELHAPLKWEGIRAILKKERIRLAYVQMQREAALISHAGVAVILLNSNRPAGRDTYLVAHELAHQWLHASTSPEWCTFLDTDCSDEMREAEADYAAMLMLQKRIGPPPL